MTGCASEVNKAPLSEDEDTLAIREHEAVNLGFDCVATDARDILKDIRESNTTIAH